MSLSLKRVALMVAVGITTIIVLFVIVVELRWDRRFPTTPTSISASADTQAIARGKYLAYGPGHCVNCHLAPTDGAAFAAGGSPPLAGGGAIKIPPGAFYIPNITPDSATGIGRRTDAELVNVIRYGVRADGRSALGFMAFQELSDSDLVAIISYLRSQPPVRHEVPPHDLNFLGKAVFAFVIKPQRPRATPAAATPSASSPAYGAYLTEVIAECAGCHTQRSLVDGHFTGPKLGGGMEFDVDGDPNLVLVTPNLTPDSATGRIAKWSEAQFIARFRAGRLIPQSIMPWEPFGRMTDADQIAVYRYLRTVPAVSNAAGPSLRPKKK